MEFFNFDFTLWKHFTFFNFEAKKNFENPKKVILGTPNIRYSTPNITHILHTGL